MIGTALTTWVAYVDLGRWNTVVALTIAVIKMTLVILFFMHVKYAHRPDQDCHSRRVFLARNHDYAIVFR